ncbi:hypothetical protein [Piscinibacter sp.]|jgi:hypothetical protein|uniref:hypothetical protein n=1 Tax=Piscinibacter sp. TaxID=1903157 RepID=UPI002F419917
MFSRPPPKNAPPPGSIDFELTDFADARHALDDLPPGVSEVQHLLKPGYWEQRRRKPVPSDRALTGVALDWLIHLPPAVRPRNLSERYPRVVNAIAERWDNVERSLVMLEDLIVDHRGGRKGFTPEVDAELRALLVHRENLAARR